MVQPFRISVLHVALLADIFVLLSRALATVNFNSVLFYGMWNM